MSHTPNPVSPLFHNIYDTAPYVEKSSEKTKNTPLFDRFVSPRAEVSVSSASYLSSPSKLKGSPRYQDDFVQCCKGLNSPQKLFNKVVELQKTTSFDRAQHIEASLNNPELFILSDSILVALENAGNGAQSSVSRVNRVSEKGSPLRKCIVKTSKQSYDRETILFEQCLSPNSRKDPRIDHILGTYKTQTKPKKYLAICENSDMDLTHFDYKSMRSPIKFIIGQLRDMAGGLQTLHRKNLIHRDIKGANLLINYQGRGKVTDTGLLREDTFGEIHQTSCTPPFAAPFIWKNLQDQLTRVGYQGTKSDVFSFGRTLQYDVILRILNDLSSRHDVDLISLCKDINASLQYYNSDLDVHLGRVILVERKTSIVAYVFPLREAMYTHTLTAIELFKKYLSPLEFDRLNGLAKLAFELQANVPESLPDMDSVEQRLGEILGDDTEIPETMCLPIEAKINSFNNGEGPIFFNKVPNKLPSPVNPLKRTLIIPDEEEQMVVKKVKYTSQIQEL